MLEFDPATGLLAMPVWMFAVVAVLIVVLAVFAVVRAGGVRTVVSIAVLGMLAYVGWLGWTFFERASGNAGSGDRVEERRLFEARVNEHVARAMVPGSPLACLDGTAGDQVAAGCEKLIFSSPDTIATAVSFLSTRLTMAREATELATASGLSYDKPLAILRQGLETDRYGIVAYLMLQSPDCKPEACDALALLRDPNKLRVNLLEKPFDVLVARYAANWQAGTRGVAAAESREVMASAPPPPPTSGQGVPVSSKYDFPSAASIPPVSIMNAEPGTPPGQAAAPAGSQAAAPKPAPKRAAAPKPPARREAAAPTQLAPAGQPAPAAAPPPAQAPAQERPQQ